MDLSQVSTKELSEELEKRAGVSTIKLTPAAVVHLTGAFQLPVTIEGPAVLLINRD